MSTLIAYFTGTGNSLAVARGLQKRIPGAQLISLANCMREGSWKPDADTVVLVTPVYCFDLPSKVAQLLKQADWSRVTYVAAVADYNLMAGETLHHIDRILKAHGKRLNAGYGVPMPENYIVAIPVTKPMVQQQRFQRFENRADAMARTIEARTDCGIEPAGSPLGRLLAPLLRRIMPDLQGADRHFHVSEACTHCGLCVRSCPVDNMSMESGFPVWYHRCAQCLRCIHICPVKAIDYGDKTQKRERYIHPEVSVDDLLADGSPQKQ